MKKAIARIFGNFGVSFFSPVLATNAADNIFDLNMTFEQSLIISFISAMFVTALTISREVEKYGKRRR